MPKLFLLVISTITFIGISFQISISSYAQSIDNLIEQLPVVTEIGYTGSVSQTHCGLSTKQTTCANDKWIELYNPNDSNIDLKNWVLKVGRKNNGDYASSYTFDSSVNIPSKQLIILTSKGLSSTLNKAGFASYQVGSLFPISNNTKGEKYIRFSLLSPSGVSLDFYEPNIENLEILANIKQSTTNKFSLNILPETGQKIFSNNSFYPGNFGNPLKLFNMKDIPETEEIVPISSPVTEVVLETVKEPVNIDTVTPINTDSPVIQEKVNLPIVTNAIEVPLPEAVASTVAKPISSKSKVENMTKVSIQEATQINSQITELADLSTPNLLTENTNQVIISTTAYTQETINTNYLSNAVAIPIVHSPSQLTTNFEITPSLSSPQEVTYKNESGWYEPTSQLFANSAQNLSKNTVYSARLVLESVKTSIKTPVVDAQYLIPTAVYRNVTEPNLQFLALSLACLYLCENLTKYTNMAYRSSYNSITVYA